MTAMVSTKGWTLDNLLAAGKQFKPIQRVSRRDSAAVASALQEFEISGTPLIIEDCHQHEAWSPDLSLDHFAMFLKRSDPEGDTISVRNCLDSSDKKISIQEFLEHSRTLPIYCGDQETERLYAKDAPCPAEWTDWLTSSGVVPSSLLPSSPDNLLLNSPESIQVETLMCYLGIGDTFTAMHKDLCASSGQNLLCYSENGGSSYWFMTAGSDARAMGDYFNQQLHRELDHEQHVVSVNELSTAPCVVYITEQKLGDLVLVPPRSCHQVVNNGGLTIKTSWSRMTLQGLSVALYHELPTYRRVGRPEIYRVRSTIHHTLRSLTLKLDSSILPEVLTVSEEQRALALQLGKTLALFDDLLVEAYSPKHDSMQQLSKETQLTCDWCGADIFQSFYECGSCVPTAHHPAEAGDGYTMCAGCYVEGRTCRCQKMTPAQCRPFLELVTDRRSAVTTLKRFGEITGEPLNIVSEEQMFGPTNQRLLFHAGFLLQQRRLMGERTSICSTWHGESSRHVIRTDEGKSCKKCHRTMCYKHTLEQRKTHSSVILLTEVLDRDDSTIHAFHVAARQNWKQDKDTLRRAQESGERPEFQLQLVDLASSFTKAFPLNAKFSRPGWYDECDLVPLSEEDLTEEAEENDSIFESSLTDEEWQSSASTTRRPSRRVSTSALSHRSSRPVQLSRPVKTVQPIPSRRGQIDLQTRRTLKLSRRRQSSKQTSSDSSSLEPDELPEPNASEDLREPKSLSDRQNSLIISQNSLIKDKLEMQTASRPTTIVQVVQQPDNVQGSPPRLEFHTSPFKRRHRDTQSAEGPSPPVKRAHIADHPSLSSGIK